MYSLHLSRRLGVRLAAAGLAAVLGSATANAGGVGRVSVMEVDEVRDAALISRAKAQYRSQQGADEGAGVASGPGGCSDMNIGNVSTAVGQPVPRNVVVVVEGPVIQENNCR